MEDTKHTEWMQRVADGLAEEIMRQRNQLSLVKYRVALAFTIGFFVGGIITQLVFNN